MDPVELFHKPDENSNYRLAHKYMDMYVESLVDEYKLKKENAFLLQSLDKITAELREIKRTLSVLEDLKAEIAVIKEQNASLTENFSYIDFTRLTVGIGEQKSNSDSKIDDLLKLIANESDEPVPAPTPALPQSPAPDAQTLDEMLKFIREATPSEPAPIPPLESKDEKAKTDETPKKNPVFKVISNILFYSCMALLIIGAVTFAQSSDPEKSLFGYRYYYIKTASMEPVLPVGSVVLNKVTPPEDIKVGDDITIYIGDGSNESYLTHRVVEIINDGELSFRTKGVNNKSNDPTPYSSKLLVGKVVLCIPFLGMVMTFVQSQLWLVIGMFALLLALSFMLKLLFAKDKQEVPQEAPPEVPVAAAPQPYEPDPRRVEEIIRMLEAGKTS